jgi:small glutamine-rich tetratricopeptide repeat-containing protein alpha
VLLFVMRGQQNQEPIRLAIETVAVQCISDAFGVDTSDAAQKAQLSIAPASLVSIFDIFLNMQQKVAKVLLPVTIECRVFIHVSCRWKWIGQSTCLWRQRSGIVKSSCRRTYQAHHLIMQSKKAKAEEFKAQGNKDMAAKNFDAAIVAYTKAIELDGMNPIYFGNR